MRLPCLLIVSVAVMIPNLAVCDGLTAQQLQSIFSSAANSGNAVGYLQKDGGDASHTIVTSLGAPHSRSLAQHLGDDLNVKDYGAIGDGVSDDTAAFQAAQLAGQAKDGVQIIVPKGNYLLSAPIYSVDGNIWRIDGGTSFPRNAIVGVTDTPSLYGYTVARSSVKDANVASMFVSGDFERSSGGAAYEKIGQYIRILMGDPSTYTIGTLTDGASVPKDATGLEVQVGAVASAMTTRLYGIHAELSFPQGTDGNATVLEAEISNNASYTPQAGKSNTKRTAHLTCSGSSDCTSAVEVDGGNPTGRFHVGIAAYQPGLRTDGYMWALWPSSSGDLTSPPTAGLAQDGHLYAAGVTSTASLSVLGNTKFSNPVQLASYKLSAVPTNCEPGQEIYVSDGRNPNESAGKGSGTPAFCNGLHTWLAVTSGAAVAN